MPPNWSAILPAPLAAAVPELYGKQLELLPAGAPQTFTFSRLTTWDVLANGEPWQRIVVKEPLGEKAADVQAEFAALNLLTDHFAPHPFLRVPRALLALTSPPALVMTKAPGQRLNLVLRGSRRPFRVERMFTVMPPVPYAGQWLAHLHTLPPPTTARPIAPLQERIEAACARLAASGVSAADIAAARAALPDLPSENDQPIVVLHGDYTLRNILAHPTVGVTVLDTALSHVGPAAHDIGWFLAALALIDRWQMLSRQRIYEGSILDTVHTTFITGYRVPSDAAIDIEVIETYTAVRLLERWAEYSEHLHRSQPLVARLALPVVVTPYFVQQIRATPRRLQTLLAEAAELANELRLALSSS